MSRGALQFGAASKPSDVMQPGAREMLYHDIFNSQQRSQDYWTQAAQYISDPANAAKGLSGFQPTLGYDVQVPTLRSKGAPPGSALAKLPDPSSVPSMEISIDGIAYKAVGDRWMTGKLRDGRWTPKD